MRQGTFYEAINPHSSTQFATLYWPEPLISPLPESVRSYDLGEHLTFFRDEPAYQL